MGIPPITAPDAPSAAPPGIDAVAAAFGLDVAGAEVVRAATRHVVRFPASGVRTFAVRGGLSGPRQEAAIAALLADAGVPAARLRAGPTMVDGWAVSAWAEVPGVDPDAPPADPATLGDLARRLHTATGPLDPRGLVPCDPIGAALAQLELAIAVGHTTDDELRTLERAASRLEVVWQDAVDEARAGEDLGAILHGDLHAGNVVTGRDGPVLVDLELAGWGPRAYDAAPVVAFGRWHGRPATETAAFDEAYGSPLTAAARARGLEDVWALWSTCWCIANRHRSAELEDEALNRLATVATGEAPRPWTLH